MGVKCMKRTHSGAGLGRTPHGELGQHFLLACGISDEELNRLQRQTGAHSGQPTLQPTATNTQRDGELWIAYALVLKLSPFSSCDERLNVSPQFFRLSSARAESETERSKGGA